MAKVIRRITDVSMARKIMYPTIATIALAGGTWKGKEAIEYVKQIPCPECEVCEVCDDYLEVIPPAVEVYFRDLENQRNRWEIDPRFAAVAHGEAKPIDAGPFVGMLLVHGIPVDFYLRTTNPQ